MRVLCVVVLRSWRFPDQWSFGYEIGYLGRSLVEGHGFSLMGTPSAKFPPVYPLLVAAAFATLGIYSIPAAVALLLFQSVCAALTAVCLITVGSRFFGRKEGIIAGLIWAVYPGSVADSVGIWYSELSIMLVLLLIIIADSKQFPLALRVVCLGGLSGLLAITDPTMLVYSVLLFLWMLHRCKLTRGWIRLAVVWTITAGVIASPWAVHNWLVLGTPTVIKPSFGLELFFGNNPHSTGGEIERERQQALAALNQEERAYYEGLSENAYFDYLGKKALDWIRMHPKEFVQLSAKRLWYFWGKFPSSGPEMWYRYHQVQLVWYVPIALLAVYGFWHSIRRRRDFVPIWLFLLVYPIPYYVTHVQQYRYRYAVEPFLVLLAAIPVTIWFVHMEKPWNHYAH